MSTHRRFRPSPLRARAGAPPPITSPALQRSPGQPVGTVCTVPQPQKAPALGSQPAYSSYGLMFKVKAVHSFAVPTVFKHRRTRIWNGLERVVPGRVTISSGIRWQPSVMDHQPIPNGRAPLPPPPPTNGNLLPPPTPTAPPPHPLSTPQGPTHGTPNSKAGSRIYRACIHCRNRKSKCELYVDFPNGTCRECGR